MADRSLKAFYSRVRHSVTKQKLLDKIENSNLSPRVQRILENVVSFLPGLQFLTIHYTYFIVTILISSVILWKSSTQDEDLLYVDCLFLATSAMTETGLNTVNLSILNTWQQVILFFLMILGSYVTVTMYITFVRMKAFNVRFHDMVEQYKAGKAAGHAVGRNRSLFKPSVPNWGRKSSDTGSRREDSRVSDVGLARLQPVRNSLDVSQSYRSAMSRPKSAQQVERSINGLQLQQGDGIGDMRDIEAVGSDETKSSGVGVRFHHSPTFRTFGEGSSSTFRPQVREVLDRATVGRNSSMHVLDADDRELLGGAEYRAVRMFAWIVPTYYFFCQFVGCLSVALYIVFHNADIPLQNGVDPWWLGIFLGVSAFNNCGLSLLDLGMAPFQENYFILLSLALLILLGNVAYPLFLRLMLWTAYKLIPETGHFQSVSETLKFSLDHPRRVYTSMFPSAHTWWLFVALVVLTGIDWLGLGVLNLNNEIIQAIPVRYRELDDFFQSVSIRTVGFGVFSISSLTIGNQVLLLLMMYISAYPFAITLRSSNVYEERSLGIFAARKDEMDREKVRNRSISSGVRRTTKSRLYFLRQQLSNQLSHDMWWLAIAVFAITCIEVTSYENDPKTYATFNIIFEVVSAYGPVGLSTGLSDQPYSLSGGFHTASKLIICGVMLRGRHRGLPVAIDKAVLLPGEKADKTEQEQWQMAQSATAHFPRSETWNSQRSLGFVSV